MTTVIPPRDNIFRGAHHPVAFQKKNFRHAMFMKLYSAEDNPRQIEASFIWDRYAPTPSLVHAYGCRVSTARNQRQSRNRNVYCGSYHLKVDYVRSLAATEGLPEVATADMIHQIENNELAHAACIIRLRDETDEEAIEGIKTVIAERLWNGSRGPLTHTCTTDRDLDPHPNSGLDEAPLGGYSDDRSLVKRALCLARYGLLLVLWKLRRFFASGR
jgi:hypothetical protein